MPKRAFLFFMKNQKNQKNFNIDAYSEWKLKYQIGTYYMRFLPLWIWYNICQNMNKVALNLRFFQDLWQANLIFPQMWCNFEIWIISWFKLVPKRGFLFFVKDQLTGNFHYRFVGIFSLISTLMLILNENWGIKLHHIYGIFACLNLI